MGSVLSFGVTNLKRRPCPSYWQRPPVAEAHPGHHGELPRIASLVGWGESQTLLFGLEATGCRCQPLSDSLPQTRSGACGKLC